MTQLNINTIKIIQHNVNHWQNKKFGLYNTYRHIDPDIILLNDTSLLNDKPLKIQQYTVYTKNIKNTLSRGTAIAIKTHISHHIHDDLETDLGTGHRYWHTTRTNEYRNWLYRPQRPLL